MKRGILGLTMALAMVLSGCSEAVPSAQASQASASFAEPSESAPAPAESPTEEPGIVYEDAALTIRFQGVSNVAGQIGMAFSLENHSDHEITVLPMDSSVNNVMVQFVSGTLATIQPGKTCNQVWMANPETVGIADSSEVTSIELALNYDDITTAPISIDP